MIEEDEAMKAMPVPDSTAQQQKGKKGEVNLQGRRTHWQRRSSLGAQGVAGRGWAAWGGCKVSPRALVVVAKRCPQLMGLID